MNKRANYLYELVGIIKTKQLKKDKKGQDFYRLVVENDEKVKIINVFSSLESIWREIEQSNFHSKKYFFFCKNYMGNLQFSRLKRTKVIMNNFYIELKEISLGQELLKKLSCQIDGKHYIG